MAHEGKAGTSGAKLVIRNIGLLLSGDLQQPLLDADTLVAKDGLIESFGREKDADVSGATTVIDANGSALCRKLPPNLQAR